MNQNEKVIPSGYTRLVHHLPLCIHVPQGAYRNKYQRFSVRLAPKRPEIPPAQQRRDDAVPRVGGAHFKEQLIIVKNRREWKMRNRELTRK